MGLENGKSRKGRSPSMSSDSRKASRKAKQSPSRSRRHEKRSRSRDRKRKHKYLKSSSSDSSKERKKAEPKKRSNWGGHILNSQGTVSQTSTVSLSGWNAIASGQSGNVEDAADAALMLAMGGRSASRSLGTPIGGGKERITPLLKGTPLRPNPVEGLKPPPNLPWPPPPELLPPPPGIQIHGITATTTAASLNPQYVPPAKEYVPPSRLSSSLGNLHHNPSGELRKQAELLKGVLDSKKGNPKWDGELLTVKDKEPDKEPEEPEVKKPKINTSAPTRRAPALLLNQMHLKPKDSTENLTEDEKVVKRLEEEVKSLKRKLDQAAATFTGDTEKQALEKKYKDKVAEYKKKKAAQIAKDSAKKDAKKEDNPSSSSSSNAPVVVVEESSSSREHKVKTAVGAAQLLKNISSGTSETKKPELKHEPKPFNLYEGLPETDPEKDACPVVVQPRSKHVESHKMADGLYVEDKTRCIFLDIDGVMRPLVGSAFQINTISFEGETVPVVDDASDFLPSAMASLQYILAKTGALIVLSSEWRRFPTLKDGFETALRLRNMPALYDETPKHPRILKGDPKRSFVDRRVREIGEWLKDHPDIKYWAAIDDLDLGTADAFRKSGQPVIANRLVLTDDQACLTIQDAKTCVNILQGKLLDRKVELQNIPDRLPEQ